MSETKQVQLVIMLRTMTNFAPSSALTEMYIKLYGTATPSGYELITTEQLEGYQVGQAALDLLKQPLSEMLPKIAASLIHRRYKSAAIDSAATLYVGLDQLTLLQMIRQTLGRTNRTILARDLKFPENATLGDAIPLICQLVGLSPHFPWQQQGAQN